MVWEEEVTEISCILGLGGTPRALMGAFTNLCFVGFFASALLTGHFPVSFGCAVSSLQYAGFSRVAVPGLQSMWAQ